VYAIECIAELLACCCLSCHLHVKYMLYTYRIDGHTVIEMHLFNIATSMCLPLSLLIYLWFIYQHSQ
jgi:hypothetical protein